MIVDFVIPQGHLYYKVFEGRVIEYKYISPAIDKDRYHYLLNMQSRKPERFHISELNKLVISKLFAYQTAEKQLKRKLRFVKEAIQEATK